MKTVATIGLDIAKQVFRKRAVKPENDANAPKTGQTIY
jgi:hypothetical protein